MEDLKIYKFYNNYYYVDKHGNVYNKYHKKKRTFCGNDGYREVELSGSIKNKNGNYVRYKVKVHRIVAELFVPKPTDAIDELEVNHIDNDRMNSDYSNLEWVTHLENVRYSVSQNRHYVLPSKGELNIKAKLKEEDVLNIRELYRQGKTIKEINVIYKNLSYNSILNIVKYMTWKHLK